MLAQGLHAGLECARGRHVVDNDVYAYHVRVYSDDWPGTASLKIRGAVVEYTIAEAP